MSPSNPSSYPSLTSSWTPASSCVASTGFWYVVYASNVVFSDMFGMPSVTNTGQRSTPTGGCVPPSYTLSVPYLTDGGCPTHYFGACSTSTSYAGQSADFIWCCPSVEGWYFNCAPATNSKAAPYGCQATFFDGAIITGSRTDLVALTGQAETHTVRGDNGVNAWGIALLSTPASSTSTVASATSTPPSSTGISTSNSSSTTTTITGPASTSTSSARGLSTGAAAGIGVGAGLAALAVLGLVIFWFVRRKYKTKQEQQPPVQSYQTSYPASYPDSYHAEGVAAQHGQSYYSPTGPKTTSPSPNMEMGQPDVLSELSGDSINRNHHEMLG